jgi:hypothetical protein
MTLSEIEPATFREPAHEMHWIGGWVSLRAYLNAVDRKKSLIPAGNGTHV